MSNDGSCVIKRQSLLSLAILGASRHNTLSNCFLWLMAMSAKYCGGNAGAAGANGCPGAGGLSFDNSTTWCLQEAGRADAKAMLDIGNENVSKTLDEWYFSKDLKKEYPHFRDYLNKVYSYVFNK